MYPFPQSAVFFLLSRPFVTVPASRFSFYADDIAVTRDGDGAGGLFSAKLLSSLYSVESAWFANDLLMTLAGTAFQYAG